MAKRLFVGSIPWSVDDRKLNDYFSQAGTVVFARVIIDRETGKSKGFGFVEMSSDEETQKAISLLNGSDLEGRKLVVNEARPMEEKPRQTTLYRQRSYRR